MLLGHWGRAWAVLSVSIGVVAVLAALLRLVAA
jgi:hypothetical protein